MNIQVSEKYRITSDPHNVVVEQLQIPKKEDSEPYWRQVSYHMSFEQAIKWLFDHQIRLSDASDLRDIGECISRVKEELQRAIRSQSVDVSSDKG